MTGLAGRAHTAGTRAAQIVLLLSLGVAVYLVYSPRLASAARATVDLSAFPSKLGDWVGTDIILSDEILQTLGATDYLLREYRCKDQRLSLYITYFNSGDGALTHNPEKCYTATGWSFLDKSTAGVPGTDRFVLQSTIAKGEGRQVVVYWYQDRDEMIVSNWNHIARVLLKMMLGRETHSLVASISKTTGIGIEAKMGEQDMEFARQVIGALGDLVPKGESS